MSHLLTKQVAQRAVQMVLSAVQALVADVTFKRGELHIVIAEQKSACRSGRENKSFEDCILYEFSVGKPKDEWDFPFDEIARSKCELSWVSGMSTLEIQTRAPHLLEEGDTSYYGSAVRNGIVVACSGVQPYFDQMISEWVLAACEALCIQAREQLKTDKDGFITAE